MAITVEEAKEYKDEFAVTCCRFEAGEEISPSNIEDPNILPDLEDSGLLEIPENCLKIGEVLGAKLKVTVDALTPLTPDLVEGLKEVFEEKEEETCEEEVVEKKASEEKIVPIEETRKGSEYVRIHIGEGRDINLDIPVCISGEAGTDIKSEYIAKNPVVEIEEDYDEDKIVGTLTRKYFKIDEVKFGDETKIQGKTLYIRENIVKEAIDSQDLVTNIELDIITPDRYGEYSNTIMDVQPIAVKEEGKLGEGITRVIDGAVIMVTGTDEKGVQIGEFGSSEGEIDRNVLFNRPGSPDYGDILIKTNVTIKEGKNMERPGPMAAHRATDVITQEIREALKEASEELIVNEKCFVQKHRAKKKKVVIVKEIMGQGAMHDNFIMPDEPVGTLGAKANVDLGNVPIIVTPLQILDGCIHALTCIGPASKETSRHYFREPLVLETMDDENIDLIAVVLVGSPQANSEKFYVSRLLGTTVEAMNPDGAIVTTEGFGNNHIDFASHIEEIGKKGIPVVGMTFSGVQGELVVGNKYMDAMVDLNKSRQGIENEILSNNCLTEEDAKRALAMLKAKISGEKIKKANRKWSSDVKMNNIDLIEKATGEKMELVPNETTLKMSEKRKKIYEKDD